jgi:predicted nucleic acid-binding protein
MAGKITYILDACALIALLDKEDGYGRVYELIQHANREEITLCMNIVNLLEVYYDRLKIDVAAAIDFRRTVRDSAIYIVDFYENNIFYDAGRLKAEYKKVSLADAVGLATAICFNATFVTCDHHELEVIEQRETIPFFWVR